MCTALIDTQVPRLTARKPLLRLVFSGGTGPPRVAVCCAQVDGLR